VREPAPPDGLTATATVTNGNDERQRQRQRPDPIPQGREVIRNSFDLIAYEPTDTAAWGEPYEKFKTLLPASP